MQLLTNQILGSGRCIFDRRTEYQILVLFGVLHSAQFYPRESRVCLRHKNIFLPTRIITSGIAKPTFLSQGNTIGTHECLLNLFGNKKRSIKIYGSQKAGSLRNYTHQNFSSMKNCIVLVWKRKLSFGGRVRGKFQFWVNNGDSPEEAFALTHLIICFSTPNQLRVDKMEEFLFFSIVPKENEYSSGCIKNSSHFTSCEVHYSQGHK